MFRKIALSALAAALVSTAVTAIPADAATKISNGVACSKSGATTKVGGYSYKCAKNSMVKNSKLTWLSVECLTAINQYNAAIKGREKIGDVAAQLVELDRQLLAANSTLTNTTTSLETAKAELVKTRAAMNAATDATIKLTLSQSVTKLSSAVITLTNANFGLKKQVSDLTAKKSLIESAPSQIASNISQSKSSAQLLCAKGL